jgi:hypothetical protein
MAPNGSIGMFFVHPVMARFICIEAQMLLHGMGLRTRFIYRLLVFAVASFRCISLVAR